MAAVLQAVPQRARDLVAEINARQLYVRKQLTGSGRLARQTGPLAQPARPRRS
jgi:hypothetical protein